MVSCAIQLSAKRLDIVPTHVALCRYFWTLPLKLSLKVASVFGDPKLQVTDTGIHNLAPKHFGRGVSHTDIPQLVSCTMQLCAKPRYIVPIHIAICKDIFEPSLWNHHQKLHLFWWPKNTNNRHKYKQFSPKTLLQVRLACGHRSTGQLSPKTFPQTHICHFLSRSDILTSCYLTHNSMDTPLLQLTYNIMNIPL